MHETLNQLVSVYYMYYVHDYARPTTRINIQANFKHKNLLWPFSQEILKWYVFHNTVIITFYRFSSDSTYVLHTYVPWVDSDGWIIPIMYYIHSSTMYSNTLLVFSELKCNK